MTTRPQILPRDAAMKKGDAYGAVPTGKRCGRATNNRSRSGLKNKSSSSQIHGGRGPQPAPVIFKKRKYKPASQWKRPAAKPCGCIWGSCLKCRKPEHKGWSAAEVAAMRADYESGMTAAAVERKHGVPEKGLRGLFNRRGIPWRKWTQRQAHKANGQFVRDPAKTEKEIAALIEAATHLAVPRALKQEWKQHWSLDRKKKFVSALRDSLVRRGFDFAPTGPHSANVQPFDYFTPAARAIVAAANIGCTSQTKKMQLRPASQGMIFEGELWYWAHDGYQRQSHGHHERGGHRPFLHRHLYERLHGPIPDGFTVIQRDGNKNNFAPKNLALRSMADCARMNHWRHNPELVRGGIAKRIAVKSWLNRGRKMNAVARAQVGALLGGGNGLFEQLTRSKAKI